MRFWQILGRKEGLHLVLLYVSFFMGATLQTIFATGASWFFPATICSNRPPGVLMGHASKAPGDIPTTCSNQPPGGLSPNMMPQLASRWCFQDLPNLVTRGTPGALFKHNTQIGLQGAKIGHKGALLGQAAQLGHQGMLLSQVAQINHQSALP